MKLRMFATITGVTMGLLVLTMGTATAGAAPAKLTRITGFKAPGTPKAFNKVGILKVGPPRARNVLVLQPGTSGSVSYLRQVADDIVAKANRRARRLKGAKRNRALWQVWAVERRENLLEDHSRLNQFKRGQLSAQGLFDYYLRWLEDSNISPHFQPVADENVPYARKWGMNVAMGDLRKVILQARKGGRKVVLGGHSLGGFMSVAYATWNFGGKPGGRDLSGLVLIDGTSGPGSPISAANAKAALADLSTSSPFDDRFGIGLPWAAGAFNIVGSSLAIKEPNAPSLLQDWPLLPAELKAPVPVTNEAAYGYVLDEGTGPPSLALVQVHAGRLAASGSPRGWDRAGEITPIQRVAAMFQGKGLQGLDGTSWYHPTRLSIDAGAINGGFRNAAQKVLNVRATLGRRLNTRILSFDAGLGGNGRMTQAARALVRKSRTPKRKLTVVKRIASYAHIDPLSAYPSNAFVAKLIPFLRKIQAGR